MRDQVETAINNALDKLQTADLELLLTDANERSISHRIAIYLEPYFPAWNVDCEYNRNGYEPKRLKIRPRSIYSNDAKAKTVFPDIIIHQRGTDNNLVVIEMKKTTSQESDDYDLEKLRAFKNQLGYRFAIFIKVVTNDAVSAAKSAELMWV